MEKTFGINAMADKLFEHYKCRCQLSKADCQEIPKFLCDCMINALVQNKKVRLERLGVIVLKPISGRNARNPKTGETFQSTSKNGVKFKPSKYVCMRVNSIKVPRRRIVKQLKTEQLPV
jgi:nucleoid DNA-binding protein